MRRLILHIRPHKIVTSSFKHWLLSKAEALAACEVAVPTDATAARGHAVSQEDFEASNPNLGSHICNRVVERVERLASRLKSVATRAATLRQLAGLMPPHSLAPPVWAVPGPHRTRIGPWPRPDRAAISTVPTPTR